MAAKTSQIKLTLVLVLMTWHCAWAQSGCSNALVSLAPCLKFVSGNSSKPTPACCSSLTGVVQAQPQCLCTMINGGGPMAGFAVNQTLAMALPAACNVKTPPVSQCSTANAPSSSAASPASAPVGSPSSDSTPSDSSSDGTPDTTTTTPSQTTTPSSTGSGSKTVPSTTGASSGAISIKSSLPITMFLVFIFSFGSTRF